MLESLLDLYKATYNKEKRTWKIYIVYIYIYLGEVGQFWLVY